MNIKFAVVWTVLLACAANSAFAQRATPDQLKLASIASPDTSTVIVGQAVVQDELQVSDSQKEAIKQLLSNASSERKDLLDLKLARKEQNETANELATQHAKALEGILKPEQFKRLNEVALQYNMSINWNTTLTNRLADKLSLTDDQKKQLTDLHRKQVLALPNLIRGNAADPKAKLSAIRAEQRKDSLQILSEDQRQKLDGLLGKEFDVPNIPANILIPTEDGK